MIILLSPGNSHCEFAPNSQYCEFQAEFAANSRCERIRSEFGEFQLNSLRICIPMKDIKPPMYDGNPLNLDRFSEKLDDWGVTVTEDMHPADAEKYVFRRFRYRLPEVLGELYFVATKEGRIKTLKEAKKWINEQGRVDAPQVAAKRWKSIKLEHDGREIRLRDWRDFRGKYTLFRRNVEDWNEGDEQARLLSMLPEAWIKRVTKEAQRKTRREQRVKLENFS